MSEQDISKQKAKDWEKLLHKIVWIGYCLLALSSFSLFLSVTSSAESERLLSTSVIIWMMSARVFGLGAFFIGALCLLNRLWTHGTLLFLGSVGLPLISLFLHGYM